MPAYGFARIADAFDRDKIDSYRVVRVSAASFDYRDEADHVFRIHDRFDSERVFSAAVAVPVEPR